MGIILGKRLGSESAISELNGFGFPRASRYLLKAEE